MMDLTEQTETAGEDSGEGDSEDITMTLTATEEDLTEAGDGEGGITTEGHGGTIEVEVGQVGNRKVIVIFDFRELFILLCYRHSQTSRNHDLSPMFQVLYAINFSMWMSSIIVYKFVSLNALIL